MKVDSMPKGVGINDASRGITATPDQLGACDDLPCINERRMFRTRFNGSDRRQRFNHRSDCISSKVPEGRALFHRLQHSYLLLQLIIMGGDLVVLGTLLLVSTAAVVFFGESVNAGKEYLALASWQLGLGTMLFLVTNWLRNNYSKKDSISDDLHELVHMVVFAIAVQSILAGLVGNRVVLLGLLSVWCSTLLFIPITRLIVKKILFRAGLWTRPTVILGCGENARRTAEALMSEWLLGCNVSEFIYCPQVCGQTQKSTGIRQISAPQFVDVLGHRIPVRHIDGIRQELFSIPGKPKIVVALDTMDYWQTLSVLYEALVPYSQLTIVPLLRDIPISSLELTHVFRHDVLILTVHNNLSRFIPRVLKRAFDVLIASALLLLMFPIWLLIAAVVRFSGPNIIYAHERIGQHGKKFKCYKFRSMLNNSAELLQELLENDLAARAEWNRDYKLRNDPRITRVGRFLRSTSLDELPQLINVLKGEMSLVGPRPVTLDELARYHDNQNLYNTVKPGITGLWQISGRNEISYEERVNLDSWYAKNWSLWYDLVILAATVRVVFARVGAY